MAKIEQFDPAQLHPSAAEAIDSKGCELLGKVAKRPFQNKGPDPFPTRQKMDTITEKDIIGEIKMAYSDHTGRTIARYFAEDGHEVGLFEEGYEALRLLSEKVLNTKPFNHGLSSEFVEETIFDWWVEAYKQQTDETTSERLLKIAIAAIGTHHIVVPLDSLEIERPFRFGDIVIAPMEEKLFVEMAKTATERNPEHSENIKESLAKMARELGHLTAVHVQAFGEPRFVKNHAERISFQFAELVRFMSPAALSWNIPYACYPHGCHKHRTTTILTLDDNKLSSISSGLLDRGIFNWRMTFAELRELMNSGFANYAAIFEQRELSPFRVRVAKSVGAYSEGVATSNVGNRLIYVMSALEHLFLRNEQEPIQSGVGDRVAFLIAQKPEDRREIVSNFKRAYALRSKQVHHLASVDDEATLSVFFKNAWIALLSAIQQMGKYQSHSDFLDAIDNVKYGASK